MRVGQEIAGVAELDEDGIAALRNRKVGFIFQTFQLIPTLTALENVMVPAELRGDRSAKGHAVDLLNQVGLGEPTQVLANQPRGIDAGAAIERHVEHEPRDAQPRAVPLRDFHRAAEFAAIVSSSGSL